MHVTYFRAIKLAMYTGNICDGASISHEDQETVENLPYGPCDICDMSRVRVLYC